MKKGQLVVRKQLTFECYCSNGFCQCYLPSSHGVLLAENDDQSKCDLPVTTTTVTETPVDICDRKDDQSTCDLPVATATVTKTPLNVCDGNDDQSKGDLPVTTTTMTETPIYICDRKDDQYTCDLPVAMTTVTETPQSPKDSWCCLRGLLVIQRPERFEERNDCLRPPHQATSIHYHPCTHILNKCWTD
ncbi:hypothetical protein LSAT2_027876 [Lamellibrachia satsuma]|nr:hypothetical protein LSAT2_027876 [Lamellibrachia satsuma]